MSGTLRRSDGVHVRIVGETSPGPGARSAEVTLEDAYMWHLGTDRAAADVPEDGAAAPDAARGSRADRTATP